MNSKQLAYSYKKAFMAGLKYRLQMLIVLCFIAGGVSAVNSVMYPNDNTSKVVLIGSLTMATVSMATVGNLDEVSAKDSAGSQIGMRVWLIDRKQIDDTQTFPLPNADREVGTVPLKSGEYMHYFDAVNESVKSNGTGEKGDVNVDFNNTLGFIMAGNRVQLMNYLEEFAGRGHVVIWQECGTGVKYIQGSLCKPMVLNSFDRKDDNEGRYVTFTFGNKHWQQPCIYTGDIITQDPVTIAADATDLAIDSTNNSYNLSVNTAATELATVSGITSDDYGKNITIYGGGGDYATTIADSTTFVLVDGETWTGNSGSSITFKIHDSETLVEVSRVQTT